MHFLPLTGGVCGGEGVSVLSQAVSTNTPPSPPHPATKTTTTNTSSPVVVVMTTKGPPPPPPPPSPASSSSSSSSPVISPTARHIVLVSEAGVTEGVSQAKDIEEQYEEEDKEYEMLPQPLAQDGEQRTLP